MSMVMDEEKARKVLKDYKVEPVMYHFGVKDIANGDYGEGIDMGFTERIKAVTVAYSSKGAVGFLRECIVDAIGRIALDGDRVLFAGDLIDELEWIGIHGIAVQDSRDIKYSQRARTISIGRLRKSYELERYHIKMPEEMNNDDG